MLQCKLDIKFTSKYKHTSHLNLSPRTSDREMEMLNQQITTCFTRDDRYSSNILASHIAAV